MSARKTWHPLITKQCISKWSRLFDLVGYKKNLNRLFFSIFGPSEDLQFPADTVNNRPKTDCISHRFDEVAGAIYRWNGLTNRSNKSVQHMFACYALTEQCWKLSASSI